MEIGIADITATTDEDRRVVALDRAINYHQNREGDTAKIVATASLFEEYLRGPEQNQCS